MPVVVVREKAQFRLIGSDIAPTDLAWSLATPAQRKGFWRQVAVLARDAKYSELSRGIDVHGAPMPARMHPREDHATGRVLIPHWSDSRFETELRWAGQADGAVLWWKAPWARIVIYHAEGIPSRIGPIERDVIGLTDESVQRVAEKARKWWAGQVSSGRLGVGVTEASETATAVAQAQQAGTFSGWHRVPPPPKPGSIFASRMPPKVPPTVQAPAFPTPLPPWTVTQKLAPLWEAAGRGRTTRVEIDLTVRRLGRSQSLETLRGVLTRMGVPDVVRTKAEALAILRRNLASRLPGGAPPAQPRFAPPTGPTGPLPTPIATAPAPKPRRAPARAQTIRRELAAYTEGDRIAREVIDAMDAATRGPRRELANAQWRRTAIEDEIRATSDAAAKRQLLALRDQAVRDGIAASEALARAVRAHDGALREIVGVADPIAWTHKTATRKPAIRAMRDEARAWVEPLVSGRGTDGRRRLTWKESDWGRSCYGNGEDTMYLVELTDVRSAIHEWGHALEDQVPGVRAAMNAFRRARTKGEKPTRMNAVTPGAFEGHEVGYKDEFDKVLPEARAYYAGKGYEDGSTELLSMGLELLHRDPAAFAAKDPEWFKLVVGILRGDIR